MIRRRSNNDNDSSTNDNDTSQARRSSRANDTINTIIRKIQTIPDDTIISEYSFRGESHVLIYKSERKINEMLMHEQNLPYPESCTDIFIRCSNGSIRAHSLLMTASKLIVQALKEKDETDYLDDERYRSIDIASYKVEHIAKLLFLFYAGKVIFTLENEQKIITRLLEIFGVSSPSIVIDIPLQYTANMAKYNQGLHEMAKGFQLRMALTRVTPNNERVDDEYFIRLDGSMEPVKHDLNSSEVIILDGPQNDPNWFYCDICKTTYAEDGNLRSHLASNHRQQRQSEQPGTSAAARRQISRPNQQSNYIGGKVGRPRKNPAPIPNQDSTDLEARIIPPPTLTSTPTTPGTSHSFRPNPESVQQNENVNCLSCGVCSLVIDNDNDMNIHLLHSHSKLVDDDGNYLGVPCVANPDSFKGTRCLICRSNYLTTISLKDHYEKVHEILEKEHYTLVPNVKCHVCKTKIGQDHNSGDHATHFFDHVRQCLMMKSRVSTTEAENMGSHNKNNPPGKGLRKPTKLVKWSSATNMKTTVAEVVKPSTSTTPSKRKMLVKSMADQVLIPGPSSSGNIMPQQKKKKTVNTDGQNPQTYPEVAKTLNISGKVLRSGRNVKSKIPMPQQMPIMQVVNEEPTVHNNDLRVSNVDKVQRGKRKAPAENPLSKGKGMATSKKAASTVTQKKDKKAASTVTKNKGKKDDPPRVAARVQQHQSDSDDNGDCELIAILPNDESSRSRRLDAASEKPSRDNDKENLAPNDEAPVPGGSKSIFNRLSSVSIFPGSPPYHSTHIFDRSDRDKQGPSNPERIPALRLQKINETFSKSQAWVCSATDETFATDDTNEIPLQPESNRSCSLYMTPEQTSEFLSVSDNKHEGINNSEYDHFQGFSESTVANMNEAAIEYARILQNDQYSYLMSEDRSGPEHPDDNETTWLLDYPDAITTVFLR